MKRIFKGVIAIILLLTCFLITDLEDSKPILSSTYEELPVTDRIPILTFHRLVPDDVKKEKYPDNQWVGSVTVFSQMMAYLYENDYTTINTEDFYEWYIGNREYDSKTVMITFDDGFYEDYYLALPILKKYNFKATSFVVGNRIGDITRPYDKNVTSYLGLDVIEEVRKTYPNFEFQSHSYNMHYYTKNGKHRIKSMSKEQILDDTLMNRQFNFTTMAYPYGDYNKKIQEVLKDEGYLVAFRFGPSNYATRNSDQYAIPRIKINGYATLETMKKWIIF